ERRERRPVRLRSGVRAGVAGSDRCLQRIGAPGTGEAFRAIERGEPSANQELVPPGAILIEQQNGLSRGTDPSPGTRRLELHQRDETVNLWFSWGELGENSAQAERIFAEPRPHPVISCGGGVTLVENQVDHLEDGGKTGAEICRTRNFERDMSVRERPLGPDDSLGDGRFRDEEGPCD